MGALDNYSLVFVIFINFFGQLKYWVGQVLFLVSCPKGQVEKYVNVEAWFTDLVLLHSTSLCGYLSHHSISDVREMADYTIASSVNIEKGKQNEEYCVEQLYRFNNKLTWKRLYPEELILKKMNHVAITVSSLLWQNWSPNVSTRLRRAYPSDVVQEFDPQLKFVTFTVHRDPEDEDVNNNKIWL